MNAHDVLTAVGWAPSIQEITEFVHAHYALTVEVAKLTAERDNNYLLALTDGSKRLLKLTHAAEDAAVVDLQSQAFSHIAVVAPYLPVQRLVPTRGGSIEAFLVVPGGAVRRARMLTYLSGVPLSDCRTSRRQAARLGSMAADLDTALSTFSHPASARDLLWDIQQAAQTLALLRHTQNAADRIVCESIIDRFERYTAPKLTRLRAQVIHNDLNPHNVIMDPNDVDRVTGIIDFGDMVHAPLIDEVAVAAAYLVSASEAPLGTAVDFVSAYHARVPLGTDEIDVLPQLIAVRQAVTIALTNWRAILHPENRDYILRNQHNALTGLRKLAALGEQRAGAVLLEACASTAT